MSSGWIVPVWFSSVFFLVKTHLMVSKFKFYFTALIRIKILWSMWTTICFKIQLLKSSPNQCKKVNQCKQRNFSMQSQFNFLCELNKNTLNMSLAKVVLLPYLDAQVFVHNLSKCSPNFSNWVIWTNNFTLNKIAQVPSMHCSLKTFYVNYYKKYYHCFNFTALIYVAAAVVTVS